MPHAPVCRNHPDQTTVVRNEWCGLDCNNATEFIILEAVAAHLQLAGPHIRHNDSFCATECETADRGFAASHRLPMRRRRGVKAFPSQQAQLLPLLIEHLKTAAIRTHQRHCGSKQWFVKGFDVVFFDEQAAEGMKCFG